MSLLIRGASVFDGTAFIGARDVFIQGGSIAEVAPWIERDAVEVIDASGMSLIPGLIDCHVHAIGDVLIDTVAFGVTTVIDMGTDIGFANDMRAEQQQGRVSYRADLVSAGTGATAPGGHGTQYGSPIPTLDSPEQADDFVRARISEGSDLIKIIWEPGDGTWPTLDEPTIEAVVKAAHEHGKIAVIHVTRYDHARRAIEMGVDGLAHIFYDEDPHEDFGRLIAGAGAFVVPTLSVLSSACGIASGAELVDEEGFGDYISPVQGHALKRTSGWGTPDGYPNAQRAVRLLVEAGVEVLVGTDAGNPGTAHGASMHRELELLAECGMSPQKALAAATSKAAAIFGLADRGVIAPGLVADLVVVDGDPSVDLSATRRIAAVIKGGQRFDREAYRQNIEVAKAAAAVPAPKPPAEVLSEGSISDFEDGLSSTFGAGWDSTTDALAGGSSQAVLEVVDGGADGSARSLRITGEVKEGFLLPWAGAIFRPGADAEQPADLSTKTGVSFWARGDEGCPYNFGVMATSLGFRHASKPFEVRPDWQRYGYTFDELGVDGGDTTGIIFVCYEKRAFSLQIDEVGLT